MFYIHFNCLTPRNKVNSYSLILFNLNRVIYWSLFWVGHVTIEKWLFRWMTLKLNSKDWVLIDKELIEFWFVPQVNERFYFSFKTFSIKTFNPTAELLFWRCGSETVWCWWQKWQYQSYPVLLQQHPSIRLVELSNWASVRAKNLGSRTQL